MLLRDSSRLRLVLGFPLPDLTEATSDLSAEASPFPLEMMVEFRGLSVFPVPGILDRRDRKEREDSLVSDLLKEG